MKIIRMGLILMAYCMIAGIALGVVRKVSKERTELIAKQMKTEAIKQVLPNADNFLPIVDDSSFEYYIGVSGTDTLGYVFEGKAYGFSSDIEVIIGVDTSFTIKGMRVISQVETPGLGSKVEDEGFIQNFIDKNYKNLKLDKDGGNIQSITGATISSKATLKAVETSLAKLRNIYEK